MAKDLLHSISEGMSGFSKGQKLIARYIIENYDKAAFMTASKLGNTVGVSESTVVRFATEVGFEGYPQLQRALQELIRNRLTAVQRMEVTSEQMGEHDILSKVLTMDIEKIRRTLEEQSNEGFEAAADSIIAAKNIYILGIRSSAALAQFMSFYFNQIFPNVRLVTLLLLSAVLCRMNGIWSRFQHGYPFLWSLLQMCYRSCKLQLPDSTLDGFLPS